MEKKAFALTKGMEGYTTPKQNIGWKDFNLFNFNKHFYYKTLLYTAKIIAHSNSAMH